MADKFSLIFSQKALLTARPASLASISAHESAGISGMAPRGTVQKNIYIYIVMSCSVELNFRVSFRLILMRGLFYMNHQLRIYLNKSINYIENLHPNQPVYSRNRRSVNAKNYFWNVYCSTTNQIRDVTATNRNSN